MWLIAARTPAMIENRAGWHLVEGSREWAARCHEFLGSCGVVECPDQHYDYYTEVIGVEVKSRVARWPNLSLLETPEVRVKYGDPRPEDMAVAAAVAAECAKRA